MLKVHGCDDHGGIAERAGHAWPGGTRLAVHLGVDLTHVGFGKGRGAERAPGGPQPDVLNDAWRDWGNRVSAWRLIALLDDLRLPAAIRARGDGIGGQSRRQPRVMGIALHPSMVGQPHRLRHLRRALAHFAGHRGAVWITTAGAILDHVVSLPLSIVPGSEGH